MTTFIDTYVSGPVQADLETFAGNFVNYIPSQPGNIDAGDAGLFYTCVRATLDITALISTPLAKVDPVVGAAVVGVWA